MAGYLVLSIHKAMRYNDLGAMPRLASNQSWKEGTKQQITPACPKVKPICAFLANLYHSYSAYDIVQEMQIPDFPGVDKTIKKAEEEVECQGHLQAENTNS